MHPTPLLADKLNERSAIFLRNHAATKFHFISRLKINEIVTGFTGIPLQYRLPLTPLVFYSNLYTYD